MLTAGQPVANVLRLCATTLHVVAMLLCIVVWGGQARGQCSPLWQPFDAATGRFPGVFFYAIQGMRPWDPDGAGPRNPVLLMGGNFDIAGTVATSSVATFDPATGEWTGFGEPIEPSSRPVRNVIVMPDNSLVATGDRGWLSSSPRSGVARWNGVIWEPWTESEAAFIALLPTGELILSGRLDDQSAPGIFKRVNNGWVPFATLTNIAVRALTYAPDGSLYVCTTSAVLKYNEQAQDFDPIGPAFSGGSIETIHVQPGTNAVIAAGTFNRIGNVGVGNIVRWTGTNWQTIGTHGGLTETSQVTGMTTLPNGHLVVVGRFATVSGVPAVHAASWDGAVWTGLSIGSNFNVNFSSRGATAVSIGPDNELYVGAATLVDDATVPSGFLRRTPTGWVSAASGTNAEIYTMLDTPEGLVVGGLFRNFAGVPNANNIARLTSNGWEALGQGFDRQVRALLRLPDGTLLAGGEFLRSGTTSAAFFARWNGTSWAAPSGPLFATFNGAVGAMTLASDGDIVVGGNFTNVNGWSAFGVARFDPAIGWRGVGSVTTNTSIVVRTLFFASDGSLYVGGLWNRFGELLSNNLVKWNGTAWIPLNVPYEVMSIAESASGEIFTAGLGREFTSITRLSNGQLFAVGTLPTGETGTFARVDQSWVQQTTTLPRNGNVLLMTQRADGTVLGAGTFKRVGLQTASSLAKWAPLPNCTPCDSIDFNQDGLFPDDNDVVLFFWVFAGANCATCSDIDFNNDGLFPDDNDLIAFLRVLAGGTCGG